MFANEETEEEKKKKFFGKPSIYKIGEPGTGTFETNPFVSIWNVTTSITLPYVLQGKYSGTIDWGDGKKSVNRYSKRTHIYSTPGIYTITITGVIEGWSFVVSPTNRNNLLEILRWGTLRGLNNSNNGMFSQCNNLTLNNVEDTPDLDGITSIQSMFIFCTSLTQINNSQNWNTSSINNMVSLFAECTLFDGNISSWNVSNVTNMEYMLYGTSFNQNIGNWNVSNVTSMALMFLDATNFNQDIGNWNVSNVTNMQGMFSGAINFNQDISSWNVSNVTNMVSMLYGCSNFNQDIGSWNVSNVIYMDGMLDNSGINQTNYDSLLVSWSGLTLQNGVNFGVNGLVYSNDPCLPYSGRTYMQNTFGWTFNGDSPGSCVQFRSIWTASSPIQLPYSPTGTYSGYIDWGDGQYSLNSYNNRTHNYTNSGNYTIKISGEIEGWDFLNYATSYRNSIKEILTWGNLKGENSSNANMFNGCNNLVLTAVTDTPNLTVVTSLEAMFKNCTSITTINNLNSWNVSSITNMQEMFVVDSPNFGKFNQDIGSWDVSNVQNFILFLSRQNLFNNGGSSSINNWVTSAVTTMAYMLNNNFAFNQPIGNWNTSSVRSMAGLFAGASGFNQNIGTWVTSAVTGMSAMFQNARSFNNGGSPSISGWNTSNVTSMRQMFQTATAFTQDIGSWNVSNVTNMEYMFNTATLFNNGGTPTISAWTPYSCTAMTGMFAGASAFNQPVGGWGNATSAVTNMNQMFFGCSLFNQNLGSWNVSNVTDMTSMFQGTPVYNNGGISSLTGWNVSNVTKMSGMFSGSLAFNQDIGSWDVSKVTSMYAVFNDARAFNNGGSPSISAWTPYCATTFLNMFSLTRAFNQPIGAWGNATSAVTNMTQMFFGTSSNGTPFNQDIGSWNVSSVTAMTQMFSYSSFNNGGSSSISGWTTSAVTTMQEMFHNATAFTRSIGSWNTSNVTSMRRMFYLDRVFNQDIGSWNVSKVKDMFGMFESANAFNNGGSPSISGWTPYACTDMYAMFFNTPFNQPIGAWGNATSAVTRMDSMFLSQLPSLYAKFNQDIGNWNVSSVTRMDFMFHGQTGFTNGASPSISGWNTSKVTLMNSMFRQTLFNQDIGAWNVSAVTRTDDMFYLNNVFDCDLSNWNVSKVTNFQNMFRSDSNNGRFKNGGSPNISGWTTSAATAMGAMFRGVTGFNHNIGSWNVSKNQSFTDMFYNTTSFNNGGSSSINGWITSAGTKFDSMFRSSAFNQPIGNWDVSKSTDFSNMFTLNIVFNQNIGNWNTSLATTFSNMFNGASAFNNGGSPSISGWNTSNVTNMFQCFTNASSFNQNIGSWNVSKLTSTGIASMFQNATSFNNGGSPSISGWTTSGVTSMANVFNGATVFNQPVGSWDTTRVTLMTNMFQNARAFNQPLSGFTIRTVTGASSMSNMLSSCGMTANTTNYSNTLIGWASQAPNIPTLRALGATGVKYNSTATASRAILTSAPYSWTITDGGLGP